MAKEGYELVAGPAHYEAIELSNGWRWLVLSRVRDELMSVMRFIEDLDTLPGFRALRSSMVRCVGAVRLDGGLEVIIKRYRPKGKLKALGMKLRGPQWRREWEATNAVMSRGVHTATPLAMGERSGRLAAPSGAVITLAVAGSLSLSEAFSKAELCQDEQAKGLPELAGRFVSTLHQKGIFHKDLHGENVLVASEGRSVVLFLLDLHRLTCSKRISLRSRLRNVAQLLASLQGRITEEDEMRLLAAYLEASNLSLSRSELVRRIDLLRAEITHRHERSRSKRCLEESSTFVVLRKGSMKVYAKRGFPVERLPEILREARSVTDPSDWRALKLSPESRVTLGGLPNEQGTPSLCVKEYPYRGLIRALRHTLGRSRAKLFWQGWWGAKVRGVPVPDAYLMWEERRLGLIVGCGVIMEAMGHALGLDNYISNNLGFAPKPSAFPVRRRLILELAALLAKMHGKGILHRDLKAGNIVVEERQGGPCLFLLDLDAMRFKRSISTRDMILNLAQLDASVPNCVEVPERLRFLVTYWRRRGRREGIRAVVRETQALSVERRKRRDEGPSSFQRLEVDRPS